jgi:hypothetical protein
VIKIENELMRVTGGAGTTTLTVERGYNKSIPTTHTSGTAIGLVDNTYISAGRSIFKWNGINLNLNRFGVGFDSTENISMANQGMVVW